MSIKEAYAHAPNWLQVFAWVVFGGAVFTAIFGTLAAFLVINYGDSDAWWMAYVLMGLLGFGAMWIRRDTAPSPSEDDWF